MPAITDREEPGEQESAPKKGKPRYTWTMYWVLVGFILIVVDFVAASQGIVLYFGFDHPLATLTVAGLIIVAIGIIMFFVTTIRRIARN